MGCPRLTYREKEERLNFLGLWKKSDGSKNGEDYYPFGLTFNSYSRENSVPNNYKFNGIEEVRDLGLNILDAKFRVLDPTIGRWWQIDPKVQKYQSVTPYNAMSNNPILRVDPLGDDDYVSYGDGKIKRVETNDKFNRYYHQDDKGKQTLLGQYNLNKNGLVDLSVGSGKGWTKALDNKKNYLDPNAAAAFLTASYVYNQESGKTVKVNQFTDESGAHSGKVEHAGKAIDIQYISTDGAEAHTDWSNLNKGESQKLANKFIIYGYKNVPGQWNVLTENKDGNGTALFNTNFSDGKGKYEHKSHFHVQNYNSSHIETVTEQIVKDSPVN